MTQFRLKIIVIASILFFTLPTISFAEKILVIDPGHGGKFPGTCGYSGEADGFCEKDANLLVGLKLREIIESTSDISVQMTRTADMEFAPILRQVIGGGQVGDLEKRMEVANGFVEGNNDNSIFISIHFNQDINSSSTHGMETYYYDGVNHYKPQHPPDPMQLEFLSENKRLGTIAHQNLLNSLGLRDRELRNDQSFYVLRSARMPAILVELGFMTNPQEEQLIKSESFQWDAAQALADTVMEYFKVYEVFDREMEKLGVFEEQEDALKFAVGLEMDGVTVFDKDKQRNIYPEPTQEELLFSLQERFDKLITNNKLANGKYQTFPLKLFHWKQIETR
ncbi:N-acetylmuramoyl-L-alanine amidase family protein [Evansella tamaricis]|uniref:N-acetylmuramoyl-L-alanine amidase n=1 Tax=Evansella tamaricis TaxID=2069301 RepID=A0ABS6JAD9_9BACI|nr:N-acetylmuramoyl-L-alanine amidase [Evansella tamaricis]MBU9710652.1 N-acetylmuramoyl-L-alanine amidase [Evansella tamaricis]